MRAYLNLRWRVRKGLMVEGRYAYTFKSEQTLVGYIIDDYFENNRSEIKFQAKWTF